MEFRNKFLKIRKAHEPALLRSPPPADVFTSEELSKDENLSSYIQVCRYYFHSLFDERRRLPKGIRIAARR